MAPIRDVHACQTAPFCRTQGLAFLAPHRCSLGAAGRRRPWHLRWLHCHQARVPERRSGWQTRLQTLSGSTRQRCRPTMAPSRSRLRGGALCRCRPCAPFRRRCQGAPGRRALDGVLDMPCACWAAASRSGALRQPLDYARFYPPPTPPLPPRCFRPSGTSAVPSWQAAAGPVRRCMRGAPPLPTSRLRRNR